MMSQKLFSVLLTIAVAFQAGTEGHLSAHLLFKHADSNGLTRQKRDLGCPLTCLLPAVGELQELGFDMSGIPSGLVNEKLFESGVLEQFCKVMSSMKSCIEKCDEKDETIEGMLKAMFHGLDFMCGEGFEEFVKYAPCYEKASPTFKAKCDAECGESSQLQPLMQDVFNPKTFRPAAKKMCTYISCHTDCEENVVKKTCENEEAAKFMRKLVKVSTEPLTDLFKDDPLAAMLLPEECENVGTKKD